MFLQTVNSLKLGKCSNHRIEKLLVVNKDGKLTGLITVKDIQKKEDYPDACKDSNGRLRVGAAIGVSEDAFDRAGALADVEVDAIIISDYDKGFLHEEDIQYICENNDNVFVDTKKKLGDWAGSANYIKINSLEYEQNKDFLQGNDIINKIIITKGNEGCLFQGKIYPTEDVPVKDISGAGDTFLAGLAVEYTRSNDIIKAINFAQKCTKIVVQKHGVSTV